MAKFVSGSYRSTGSFGRMSLGADPSHNPATLYVQNKKPYYGMIVNQDGAQTALYIDSVHQTGNVIHIDTPATTTGYGIQVEQNLLTSGGGLWVLSNAPSATQRSLVKIENQHASAVNVVAIETKGAKYAISGSSTSTGSFGAGHFDGRVGIGLAAPAYGSGDMNAGLHIHSDSNQLGITNDTTGATSTDGFGIAVIANRDAQILQKENASMQFYTNDTHRMTVSSSGEVGIGTATPTAGGAATTPKLHVNGPLRVDGNIAIAPGSSTPYISGGSVSTIFRNNANDASLITILNDGTTTFVGNVTLDNGNANGANLALASSGNTTWEMDNSSGDFRLFRTGGQVGLGITADYSVGIGTTSPGAAFEVSGSSGETTATFIGEHGVTMLNTSIFQTGVTAESDGTYNLTNVLADSDARFLRLKINTTATGEEVHQTLQNGYLSFRYDINIPGGSAHDSFVGSLEILPQKGYHLGAQRYFHIRASGVRNSTYWGLRYPGGDTGNNDPIFWADESNDYLYVYLPFDRYRSSGEQSSGVRGAANIFIGSDTAGAISEATVVGGSVGGTLNQVTMSNHTGRENNVRIANELPKSNTQQFGALTASFAGNVGIGETSPLAELQINGSSTNTDATTDNAAGEIKLRNTSDTDNNYAAITLLDATDSGLISRIAFVGDDHSGNKGSINMYTANGSGLVRRLRLANNGEIWLADGGGNVGIGTTGPADLLHMSGSGDSVLRMGSSSTGWAGLRLQYKAADKWFIQSTGDGTGDLKIMNGSETVRWAASGSGPVMGMGSAPGSNPRNWEHSSGEGGIVWYAHGTDGGGGGNAFIAQSSDTSVGYAMQYMNAINGASGERYFAFYRDDSQIGTITLNGTTNVQYNTSSDYRLKENITALTGSLARVVQIKPSSFNFIIEPSKLMEGFIAHELQEVVPVAVSGEKDGMYTKGEHSGSMNPQGVDAGKVTPLLTGAIQELITEIKFLRAAITGSSDLNQLKALVSGSTFV